MAVSLSPRRRAGRRLAALAVASALTLSACSGDSDSDAPATGAETSTGSDAEAGVAYGASLEEYQAAFADVEPVTLSTQTPGAPDSLVASYMEEYAAALDEWSDGKVTLEINYADAIAPATEVYDAVADGRLDLGLAAPTYEPERYPAANGMLDLTFTISGRSPLVAALQGMGTALQTASGSEIRTEIEEQGAHALIPLFSAGTEVLACTEPRTSLADFDGRTVRAGARKHLQQFEALGMSTVSIAFPEMFESLQRGVIDCSPASALSGVLTGIFELAPHLISDPDVGISSGSPSSVIVNSQLWEELPTVAKQLIHDRTDVFLSYLIKATLDSYVTMHEQIEGKGGSITPFAEDARAAVQQANEKILDESRTELAGVADPAAFVDGLVEASEHWLSVVTDDLGFDGDQTPAEFVDWYADQDMSIYDEFMERLFVDVFNEYRAG